MNHTKNLSSKESLKRFQLTYPKLNKYSLDTIGQLADSFVKELCRVMTEQPNGLVIKGIGYFGMAKFDSDEGKDYLMSFDENKNFYFKPEQGFYVGYFYPQVFRNKKMSRYIFKSSNYLKKQILKTSEEGVRYINHADFLQKLKLNGRIYNSRKHN